MNLLKKTWNDPTSFEPMSNQIDCISTLRNKKPSTALILGKPFIGKSFACRYAATKLKEDGLDFEHIFLDERLKNGKVESETLVGNILIVDNAEFIGLLGVRKMDYPRYILERLFGKSEKIWVISTLLWAPEMVFEESRWRKVSHVFEYICTMEQPSELDLKKMAKSFRVYGASLLNFRTIFDVIKEVI